MNRPVFVGLVVLVIVGSVAGASSSMAIGNAGDPVAAEPGTTDPGSGAASMANAQDSSRIYSQESQEFDNTTFEITVHENGSATWTFRHERRFATADNETAARANFETFAEEFENNETGLYERFSTQAHALTETGTEMTGREMEATDFRRSARVEEQFTATGVVEMSFTWKGFGTVEDGTVVVGDVFRNIYISSEQEIVIEAGGDLAFRSVEPEAEASYPGTSIENANSVRWAGEMDFHDGHPRAVFDHPDSTAGGDANIPLSSATGDGSTDYLVGGLLVVALAVAIAAVVWYRRRADTPSRPESGDDAAAESTDAADPEPTPTAQQDAGGDAEPTPESDAADPAALPDDELLTDEDRVVKLIRENGGRMKQVNIVEETGWSKSKVSMLLSDMEEEGTISKLRVGRENIISLEGFEPEATKSPFEE